MKNALITLSSILFLLIFVLLTIDTKYEFISFIFAILFLATTYVKDLYKYNIKKKQLSQVSFELKRDNLLVEIINCFIFVVIIYINNLKDSIMYDSNNFDISFNLLLFLAALIQLYVSIFHKPTLSTEGFLCSDGKFLNFNDIKNILIEDTKIKSHKKITVTYEPKNSILFKIGGTVDSKVFQINNLDYQSIKNHIQIYAPNKLIQSIPSQAN